MNDNSAKSIRVYDVKSKAFVDTGLVEKSEEEWKAQLTKEQFSVARKEGTERAFSHPYNEYKKTGTYTCVCCGLDLFRSEHKFDSGTGWPSFYKPVADENIAEKVDRAFFMTRREVHCPRCGCHLGHVFPDGPKPTGLRYCINGVTLDFVPDDK